MSASQILRQPAVLVASALVLATGIALVATLVACASIQDVTQNQLVIQTATQLTQTVLPK